MPDTPSLFETRSPVIWPLALRWGPCVGYRFCPLWVGMTPAVVARLWDDLTGDRVKGGSAGAGLTVDTVRGEHPVASPAEVPPPIEGPLTLEAWHAHCAAPGGAATGTSPLTRSMARILTEPRRSVWAVRWDPLAAAGTDWMGIDDLLAIRLAAVQTAQDAARMLVELTRDSDRGTYRAITSALESPIARTWWRLLPAKSWAFLLDPDPQGVSFAPQGLSHPSEVAARMLHEMPVAWWQACSDETLAVLLGTDRADVRALAITSLASHPAGADIPAHPVARR